MATPETCAVDNARPKVTAVERNVSVREPVNVQGVACPAPRGVLTGGGSTPVGHVQASRDPVVSETPGWPGSETVCRAPRWTLPLSRPGTGPWSSHCVSARKNR